MRSFAGNRLQATGYSQNREGYRPQATGSGQRAERGSEPTAYSLHPSAVRASSVLLASLFLAACAVGPDYRTPDVATPDQFVSADGVQVSSAEVEQDFWKSFHDATLDALIEQALGQNHDLRIAQRLSLQQVADAKSHLREADIALWYDTLDAVSSAGFTDTAALADPESIWGALIDAGISAIQTDHPDRLKAFIRSRVAAASEHFTAASWRARWCCGRS